MQTGIIKSQIPNINKLISNSPEIIQAPLFRDEVNAELLKSLYQNSIPFVSSFEMVNGWESVLLNKFGGVADIRTGDYADPVNYCSMEGRKNSKVNFGEYYAKPTHGYLANFKLSIDFVQQCGLKFPLLADPTAYYQPSLWVGPKGAVTPLHQDGVDNVAYHLKGIKKWTLIHPRYWRELNVAQPFPEQTPNLFVSQYDFRKPEVQKMLADKVNIITVTLTTGQALYLPAGWFHFVETEEAAVMINFFVDPEKQLPMVLTK